MTFYRVVVTCLAVGVLSAGIAAQAQKAPPQQPKVPRPAAVKIREGVFRVGNIEVDTAKKELRVAGILNENVTTLEWVANTRGGPKAYESAFSLDSDAATFNAALLLMGADPARSRVPTKHFDPVPPKGDPMEIFVEWTMGSNVRRVRIEEFLLDQRTKTTLPVGPWVYTGSSFINGRYMAELDGVLIGFVHSPAPIIENPRAGAVEAFGSVVLNNKGLGLPSGMRITMIIQAGSASPKGRP